MPRPPSRGGVTEGYGWRTWTSPARMHWGEDTIGDGNYAPVTGTVVFAGYFGGLGNLVGVREAADPSVIWWVGHHAWLSVGVGEGVTEGVTKLGQIGTTGNSTGIHAHTERRVGGASSGNYGTATNPREYYTAAAGDAVTPFPNIQNPEQEDETKEHDMKVIAKAGTGSENDEVMLVAPWLAHATDEKQRGYLVTADKKAMAAWLRIYSPTLNGLPHSRVDRDGYLAMQDQARLLREQWILSTSPTVLEVGSVNVDNAEVISVLDALPAAIARAFFAEQKKEGN